MKLSEVRAGREAMTVTRTVVTVVATTPAPSPRPSPTRGEGEEGNGQPSSPTKGEGEGPTFAQRIGNFKRDMGVVVDQLFAGKLPVEKRAMVKVKLEICSGCEFWRPLWPGTVNGWGTCGHPKCGCLMGFKAMLTELDCPMGHWKKRLMELGLIGLTTPSPRPSPTKGEGEVNPAPSPQPSPTSGEGAGLAK